MKKPKLQLRLMALSIGMGIAASAAARHQVCSPEQSIFYEIESPGSCIHPTWDFMENTAYYSTRAQPIQSYSFSWIWCRGRDDIDRSLCVPCSDHNLPGSGPNGLCLFLFTPQDCRWSIPSERIIWTKRKILDEDHPLAIRRGVVGFRYDGRRSAEFVPIVVSGVLLNNHVWLKKSDFDRYFVQEHADPNYGSESTRGQCLPGRAPAP